jgi:nicotinamide-nucleotide amidase
MTSETAAAVLSRLVAEGRTIATAESLTGGGVGAALTAVPGSSRAYVGGVVSYATRVKVELLDIPPALVEEHGVVSEQCARAMAQGVRRLLGADVGVATTGVAGPDRQEDQPAGRVFVAVADEAGDEVRGLRLPGDRDAVRASAGEAALDLVARRIGAFS